MPRIFRGIGQNTHFAFINIHTSVLIAGIVRRNGSIVIPGGSDVIRSGDDVIVVTQDAALQDIHDILRQE